MRGLAEPRRRLVVRGGVAVALGLFVAGLVTPVFETDNIVLTARDFTILSGIESLWSKANYGIAALVFAFSIVFPLVKLGALVVVERAAFPARRRADWLRWIERMGRWSLLDVLAIVVLYGGLDLGVALTGEPRYGIYLFAAAVLLSMALTGWVARGERADADAPPRRDGPEVPLLCVATIALVALGCWRPVLWTSKWLVYTSFSFAGEANTLLDEGEFGLAAVTWLFVAAVPILAATVELARWIRARVGRPARVWGVGWAAWSCPEVAVLAVFVVRTKLAETIQTSVLDGMWYLLAGAVAANVLAWLRAPARPGGRARAR